MHNNADNSFILTHLPKFYSHHPLLKCIRSVHEAPTKNYLVEKLCSGTTENPGLDPAQVWQVMNQAMHAAEETEKRLTKHQFQSVNFWSDSYPPRLREIDQPPWNIFYIGKIPQALPTLAVVGARKPNRYGIEVLNSILPHLKTYPLQIVSGLAYGIDAIAHHLACETGIPNFAVLGAGLDVLYPEDHMDLAAKILNSGGGLLSEYPPGTKPLSYHFPYRNRIIAALSQVVWIVQGTSKSGSLHTAKHALEQSRIVVTTPGDIFSELSALPNWLLYHGGHPVYRADDLDLLFKNCSLLI